MDDFDVFVIDFRLADSEDVSPTEFRSLFRAVDELTRALLIEQMRLFIETASLSDAARNELFGSILRLSRFVSAPAEVKAVRRQSPWSVLIALPVSGMIWAMRKLIAPEIMQAWNESQLKDNFKRFVRDGLFQGAKEQLEASAAAKPKYGNLRIDDIAETGRSGPQSPAIVLTLKRTEVLEYEVRDRDLMNEFLTRIGMKPQ